MIVAVIVLSAALALSIAVIGMQQRSMLANAAMMRAHAERAMNDALSISADWREMRDNERKWEASERVAIEVGRPQGPKPPGFPSDPSQTDGASSIADESAEFHRLVS